MVNTRVEQNNPSQKHITAKITNSVENTWALHKN